MKQLFEKHGLVLLEVALFVAVIAVLAVDEFVGLPLVFEGGVWEQHRMAEFVIEAALIAAVGLISVLVTLILQRRLRRAESFLRVCGWCKKVSADGAWIPFEEYLTMKYHELATHGICEECQARMLEEARRRHAKASPSGG